MPNMKIITRSFTRAKHALYGICYATKHDYSYRHQFYLGALALIIIGYLLAPLTGHELLFLVLAWALILITELQNSAFESVLDHLHPESHEAIGRGKDMAAGAVLIAGLFLVLVIGVLFCSRITQGFVLF